MATAAIRGEDSEDSSQDSEDDAFKTFDVEAGSLELVRQTLEGMAARSPDEGIQAMGRHARTIRLGRTLWQSPPLDKEVSRNIAEHFCDDGRFPQVGEIKKAQKAALNPSEERPAPFAGKTKPYASLSTIAYGHRRTSWLGGVQRGLEPPTAEQLAILIRVAERVLLEARLEKEGPLLHKSDPRRISEEQPLLGFCHGSLGTGKSRVIK